jgi:hypothetical protein
MTTDVFGNCVPATSGGSIGSTWDPTSPPCTTGEVELGGYCYPCQKLIEENYTPLPATCMTLYGPGFSTGGTLDGGTLGGGTWPLFSDPGASPFMPGGNMVP